MPVESYITPPLRCFKCQGFGHTSGRCQNKESCARCAGDHNSRHCQTESVWCVNYRGSHTARSTRCPVYLWASKVQDCKNARGCSWTQAVELCGDCPFAFATPAATVYNQSNVTKPINPSEGPKFTFKVDETTKDRTLIHTKNDQEVKIAQTQLVSPEVKAPRDSDNLVKTDSVEHNPSFTLSLSPVTDRTSTEPTISESPYKNNCSTPLFSTPPPPNPNCGSRSDLSKSLSKNKGEESSLIDVTSVATSLEDVSSPSETCDAATQIEIQTNENSSQTEGFLERNFLNSFDLDSLLNNMRNLLLDPKIKTGNYSENYLRNKFLSSFLSSFKKNLHLHEVPPRAPFYPLYYFLFRLMISLLQLRGQGWLSASSPMIPAAG